VILIYDVCYRLYFWLKRYCRRNGDGWVQKTVRKFYRWYGYYFELFLNRKIALWLEKHPAKRGLNTKKRDENYTVSLTSFPARIEYVHIAIETLMRQTFKPDHIILWLAESQFPDKKLPNSLLDQKGRGLTIRWCDDLKSHKKYFYAFQEFSEDNVILADDDAFYPRDMLAKLIRLHKKYPKDIVGTVAGIISPQISSMPSIWKAQEIGKRYISTWDAQPFSGQGTLYPANWYPQELFNKEKALSMAGTADDLWLKAMSLIAGIKTTMVFPMRRFPVNIIIKNDEPLFHTNNADGINANDKIWSRLVREYSLDHYNCNMG